MIKYAGIDYSMTCPCITILSNKDTFSHYYITPIKKHDGYRGQNIYGFLMPDYNSTEERFDIISNWALKILDKHKITNVCLEGYSMNSKGQVFNIGENTGLLKNGLYKKNIKFMVPTPQTIKSFTRTFLPKDEQRVNNKLLKMDKGQMVRTYDFVTGRNLETIMKSSATSSPVNDIADSYFMALYALKNF